MRLNENHSAYANYRDFAVQYDRHTNLFSAWYAEGRPFLENGSIRWTGENGMELSPSDAEEVIVEWERYLDKTTLTILYTGGAFEQANATVVFLVTCDGLTVDCTCAPGLTTLICGELSWGADMERDTFSVNLDQRGPWLRSALGPACSAADNALFDRCTDKALEVRGEPSPRLQFCWERKGYDFRAFGKNSLHLFFSVQEDLYVRRFRLPYKPINKKNTFPEPPCGWMTWYAVQFRASEETVLENARWQKEHLADFGANTIWVDWEWYHASFDGVGPEGIHSRQPDPKAYPHGLAYVAEEIKRLGFIPALWIGATNEPAQNDDFDDDMVLAHEPFWSGQYMLDITNPRYLEEYLPKTFRQIKDWGYRALKWDCLPHTYIYADIYHDRLHHAEQTSEQAVQAIFRKAREVVGKDFYMLSCAGESREILSGTSVFDAARIGADIFAWAEFKASCVDRVMQFYPFHNVMHYNDPDNLVVRPEHNTSDQAVSRVSFLSLLGLPITLGDNLPELPADRVELLRRCLPALDIHPANLQELSYDGSLVLQNLMICRPFEQWNIVNLLNLSEEDMEKAVELEQDLSLDPGRYLVYDFWNHAFLGEHTKAFFVQIRPNASRTVAVRRALDRPQLLSTSRHISQGGPDLIEMCWNSADHVLSGRSRVVAGDRYEISLHVPENWIPCAGQTDLLSRTQDSSIWTMAVIPEQTGEWDWSVSFE